VIDIDWNRYVGRTTYGNIASLEAQVVPRCNIPLEPRDFSVKMVMAIPMEGVRVDGRIGKIEDSTFITTPEILKVADSENPVQMAFKVSRGRRSLELLTHPDNPAIVLVANGILQVAKSENKMPLGFRLDISKALVIYETVAAD